MAAPGRVEFKNVAKDFRLRGGATYTAIADLSFSVEPGEVVVIVGQTGAGKSTALSLLLGLSAPSRGTVGIDGRDPHAEAAHFRGRIGIIFQTDRLMPWRTALGNAVYGLEILGREKGARERAAMQWLERLGLAAFADAWPHQLSGGMRQRVSIARTFALDPDILVADEAFSHLDELTARDLRRDLLQLVRESGKTTIFVTHSVDEAVTLGDRILVFARPGRVARTLTVPAGIDEARRTVIRAEVVAALEDARAAAPAPASS